MIDRRSHAVGTVVSMMGLLVVAQGLGWAARAEAPAGRSDIDPPFSSEERRRILELSPLGAPPPDPSNRVADDPAAARLGQRLFFDAGLSSAGVACATCHVPQHDFTDGKALSEGAGKGRRHTPSLWNVAYNRWYFWDGRADSLWSQALVPLESDTEMAGDRVRIARRLRDDPEIRGAYEAVFGPMPDLDGRHKLPDAGHPVPGKPADARSVAWAGMEAEDRAAVDRVFSNVGKAIAAYERRLISRDAPFDRFAADLRSGIDHNAMTPAARRGLRLFIGRAGCRTCHGGPNFTDGEFHDTGSALLEPRSVVDDGRHGGIEQLLASPFNLRGPMSDDRSDRAGETLRLLRRTPETYGQFKTPSLRNVTRISPYMHRGQLGTMREVLSFYSTQAGPGDPNGERILKPLRLTEEEIGDLSAFLDALTDESLDPALLAPPPH